MVWKCLNFQLGVRWFSCFIRSRWVLIPLKLVRPSHSRIKLPAWHSAVYRYFKSILAARCHIWLWVVTIIALVLHSYCKLRWVHFFATVPSCYYYTDRIFHWFFFVGKWKGFPMHQRIWHLDIICRSYELSKLFLFGRGSKISSSTEVHIDFGDVHKVMMAVLDRVQFFGVHPSYVQLLTKDFISKYSFLCISAYDKPTLD